MKTLFILFYWWCFFFVCAIYNTNSGEIHKFYVFFSIIIVQSMSWHNKNTHTQVIFYTARCSKLNYTFYFGRSSCCHFYIYIYHYSHYKIIFQWKYDERNLHYLTIYVLFYISKLNDEIWWNVVREKVKLVFAYRLIGFNYILGVFRTVKCVFIVFIRTKVNVLGEGFGYSFNDLIIRDQHCFNYETGNFQRYFV